MIKYKNYILTKNIHGGYILDKTGVTSNGKAFVKNICYPSTLKYAIEKIMFIESEKDFETKDHTLEDILEELKSIEQDIVKNINKIEE